MNRLSIRLRVTLVFAAVMALVLGAVGLFGYLRFENDLDDTINSGLEARSADIAALVRNLDSNPQNHAGNPVGRTESFAQVLGPGGVVTASSEAVERTPLLSPPRFAVPSRGPSSSTLTRFQGFPRGRGCSRSRSATATKRT